MKRHAFAVALTAAAMVPSAGAGAADRVPQTDLILTVTKAVPVPAGVIPPVDGGPGLPVATDVPAAAFTHRRVTLTCEPTGGTHPRAAQACADLAKAGDFAHLGDLRPPQACYMIFAPVSVTARGRLKGQRVSFAATYANDCILISKTDWVFAF